MSIANNLAKRIKILYEMNEVELACEKSKFIIQNEITDFEKRIYEKALADLHTMLLMSLKELRDANNKRNKSQ